MFKRVLEWALIICIGAVAAAEAVGQALPDQTSPELSAPQTAPTAHDMTGWNRVGELRDGQRIIVSEGSGFPIHCVFRGTTDHSLFCDTGNLVLGFYQREIARDDVAWLRTDNYPRDRGIVMGVLGTSGVIFGATTLPASSTAALKTDSALLLGTIGVGVGYVAAIPIAFFMPGKTIYAQPRPPSASRHSLPLKKRPAQPIEPAQRVEPAQAQP
jgi:hypothetical protein